MQTSKRELRGTMEATAAVMGKMRGGRQLRLQPGPPGVWPAPGEGFRPTGAASGGICDCFAHAVHAAAGGGGCGI